jgi:outer membrane protein assembly factor BamD
MHRWIPPLALLAVVWLAFPYRCPAPLVYRPGEGWVYETPGEEGKWTRTRAKDQLEVAEQAFAAKKYGTALKAARRTAKVWPLSDYAPKAQYLVARCYEAKKHEEKAFKEYQRLVEKYPKVENYQEVLLRQFEIANLFLRGRWFKLWGYLPLFPSMDRTVKMYESLIRNGPYSPVAPQAQMNIGAAREKQATFFNRVDPFRESVAAYLRAADRYFDNKPIASEAVFKAGRAYYKQAGKADYDQSVAGQAITTFGDFATLYPNDPRLPEAQKMVSELRTEQARGSFNIARFYEKKKRWTAALIYYNEATLKDPNSSYAADAKKRMEQIRKRLEAASTTAQK